MNCIALIPARSGSKRLPHKNIKILGAHPLLAYTIQAAKDSGVFREIIVSTDSREYSDIAQYYGAASIRRPPEYAGDGSPDSEWISHVLKEIQSHAPEMMPDTFAILRPTSPFRTGDTIKRAYDEFIQIPYSHAMKAVELVSQHPGKMWIRDNYHDDVHNWVRPLTHEFHQGTHYSFGLPTQSLAPVYVQNASLDMWTRTEGAPTAIMQAFFTHGYEGYDINDNKDWQYAKWLVANGRAQLPVIDKPPYKHSTMWEDE